ncbi:uncharacterized protein J8A68_003912, partial [[Candida] subhashii]
MSFVDIQSDDAAFFADIDAWQSEDELEYEEDETPIFMAEDPNPNTVQTFHPEGNTVQQVVSNLCDSQGVQDELANAQNMIDNRETIDGSVLLPFSQNDLNIDDVREGDERAFPRATILGDDKLIYLMEFKRKSYKRFIYLHGLIIDKDGKIVNPSARFQRNNGQVIKFLKERKHPFIILESVYNKDTSLFPFYHEALWNYVTPSFFQTETVGTDAFQYRRYVSHPLKKSSYQQIKGALVTIGSNQSFVIHVPYDDFSKENIAVTYEAPEYTSVHTENPIDQSFQGLTFTEDDFNYLYKGTIKERSEEGMKIYAMIYKRVIGNSAHSQYFAKSFHVPKDKEFMYRYHQPATIDSYAGLFGRFYCIINCFECFGFIGNSYSDQCKELVAAIIKSKSNEARLEKMIDLFIYFNTEDGGSFLRCLLYPYLRKLKNGKYFGTTTLMVRLDAIKNFYKFAIFIRSSEEERTAFSLGENWPRKYKGWMFVCELYKNLMNIRGDGSMNVSATGVPGKCTVDGQEVDKNYLVESYYKSAIFYHEKFQEICRITGKDILISEVFQRYQDVSKYDYQRNALGENVFNRYFSIENLSESQKSKLLNVIDDMSKALATIIFMTSANTFRSSELLWIATQGDNYQDRDLVYLHGSVVIRSTYNKNRSFNRRLRFTTKLVTMYIVNHVTAVRALYLQLLQPNYPSLTTTIFDVQELRDPSKSSEVFYKKFLFVSQHGRLITLSDLYAFQAKVLGINRRDVLGIRVLRQAITMFIRDDVEVGNERYLLLLKAIDDNRQGHTFLTAESVYGRERHTNESMHLLQDVKLMIGFFNDFFRFLGITHWSPNGKLLEATKPRIIPTSFNQLRILLTEDILDAAQMILPNFEFRNPDQATGVSDVAYGLESNRFILAPTGFGKTLIFSIPLKAFARYHEQNPKSFSRVLSVLMLPYSFLVIEMIERLGSYLNVQNVKDYETFLPTTDVLVGVYNDFVRPGFINFIRGFNLRYESTNVLGLIIIDEVHCLLEEFAFRKLRKFSGGTLNLFWKRIYLSATVEYDFKEELSSTFNLPEPQRLNF